MTPRKKKKNIRYSITITPDFGGRVRTFRNLGSRVIFFIIITLFALAFALSLSLIIFTPIRTYIPGYSFSDEKTRVILSQQFRLDSLSRKVASLENYQARLRSVLNSTPSSGSVSSQQSRDDGTMNVRMTRLVDLQRRRPGEAALISVPIVRGRISQHFSPAMSHYGIDIATLPNEPISVIADGVVLYADWSVDFGFTVIVQHDFIVSFYKHCNTLLVREGEQVKKGQTIALTGNTGLESSGPHLHLELWKDGIPQNPENLLLFEQ